MLPAAARALLCGIGLPAVLFAGAGSTGSAEDRAGGRFEALVSEFGLDPAERRRLLDGEAIVREEEGRLEEELCVRIVAFLPKSLDDAIALYRSGGIFAVDPQVPAFAPLETGAVGRSGLEAASWTTDADRRIRRLREAAPGDRVNLSAGEIARFRALSARHPGDECAATSTCGQEAVNLYRTFLHERWGQYRDGGLSAIAAYDRGDGAETRPGAQLASAARASALLSAGPVGFREAFLGEPRKAGFESRYFWIDRSVRDSSTLSLVHVMLARNDSVAIAAERYFYVGHSYNASQGINVLVARDGGTFVFYENRTYTDQVKGFFPALRRAMGRRQLREVLLTRFRAMQA